MLAVVVERHLSFHTSLQAALSSGCSNTDLSTSLLSGQGCTPECTTALKGELCGRQLYVH